VNAENLTDLDVILIVTRSSAALIVQDRIVSAVVIDEPAAITLAPTIDGLSLVDPTIENVTSLSGC
jgi:hypothetical protein